MRKAIVLTAALVSCGLGVNASAQQADMTFFITSVGSGKGADLGGLAGADAHCQTLAQAAGAGNKTWRAYLSTNGRGGANAINARDRIGNGPWQNAKGVVIATSVADLHSDNNKMGKANALDEKGPADQGPRRLAKHARHPDRFGQGRPRLSAEHGPHL